MADMHPTCIIKFNGFSCIHLWCRQQLEPDLCCAGKETSTDDGLVNGAIGTVTGFHWGSADNTNAEPDEIELEFDSDHVSQQI